MNITHEWQQPLRVHIIQKRLFNGRGSNTERFFIPIGSYCYISTSDVTRVKSNFKNSRNSCEGHLNRQLVPKPRRMSKIAKLKSIDSNSKLAHLIYEYVRTTI